MDESPLKAWQIYREHGLFELLSRTNGYLNYINSPFAGAPSSIPKPAFYDVVRYMKTWGLGYENALDMATNMEKPIMEDLFENLKSNDVFYDIGAADGEYTLKVANIIDPENIVAIEPGAIATELESRASDRGLPITLIKSAVSADESKDYWRTYRNGQVSITSDPDEAVTDEVSSVDATDISNMGLPEPTVVKIDVNGWDLDALRAIRPFLARDECRLVYIEVEPPSTDTIHRHPELYTLSNEEIEGYFDSNWSFDEMLMLFSKLGYKTEYMMDRTNDLFIKAMR